MPIADPLAPTPEFEARLRRGREFADRGEFHAAEGVFRTLVTEARASHPGNHAKALSSLTTLYGRAGRYLEAHTLASRLAALARSMGPAADRTLAHALSRTCGALSQLRLADALGEALADLSEVLARLPARLVNVELEYHVAAAAHATTIGAIARAREHVEAYRKILEAGGAPDGVYRWALAMADGRVLLREGRAAQAREVAARLRTDVPPPEFGRLHGLVLEVEIHSALGEREEAVRAGREALERMAGVDRASFLAADYVHQGDLLARAFERLGEVDLAHEAYDRMAKAVLVSLEQVDECSRWLPELGFGTSEDQTSLSLARKQFLREQQAVLSRVARLLERHDASHVRDLLAHPGKDGLVVICAWCESARTSEGVWLPIGHFVPRAGPFEVTHGICPPCALALNTSMQSVGSQEARAQLP